MIRTVLVLALIMSTPALAAIIPTVGIEGINTGQSVGAPGGITNPAANVTPPTPCSTGGLVLNQDGCNILFMGG